nr:unnamed protein product [Spirometra erinaceieuropaei]
MEDTFVNIDRDQLVTFKEDLNAVFRDIEFTMEEEENNQLAFLDVLKLVSPPSVQCDCGIDEIAEAYANG